MSNNFIKNILNNFLDKKTYNTKYAYYPLNLYISNKKKNTENEAKHYPSANQE